MEHAAESESLDSPANANGLSRCLTREVARMLSSRRVPAFLPSVSGDSDPEVLNAISMERGEPVCGPTVMAECAESGTPPRRLVLELGRSPFKMPLEAGCNPLALPFESYSMAIGAACSLVQHKTSGPCRACPHGEAWMCRAGITDSSRASGRR